MRYKISDSYELKKLPGSEILQPQYNRDYKAATQEVFVTLALPTTARSAAQPIAISSQKPNNLPSNHLAIRGVLNGGQILYDLEKFYMPETQAATIKQEVRGTRNLLVEVKVDRSGHPALVGLWVKDKKYDF